MMSRRLLNVTMGAARQCLSSLRVIKYKPDCPMLTVDTYLQHPGTCTNYGRKLPKAHCRHFLAIPGTCTNYWCRETVLIVADSNVVSRISKFSLSQLPGTCSDPVYQQAVLIVAESNMVSRSLQNTPCQSFLATIRHLNRLCVTPGSTNPSP